VKKRVLSLVLLIFFLVEVPMNAASASALTWNSAKKMLESDNLVLKMMSDSEKEAEKQYRKAVDRAKVTDTEGIHINIGGSDIFIDFEPSVKMLMIQQKELLPKQMKYSWDMASKSRKAAANGLVFGLRGLYLGLYSAKENFGFKQKKLELKQVIYNQDELKYKKGMISELELEESAYQLAKAENDAEAAKRNYENTQRAMNNYIGNEIDYVYDIVDFEEKFNYDRIKTSEYYEKKALSERIEIARLRGQINLLEEKIEIIDKVPLSLNTTSVRQDYKNTLVEIESYKSELAATEDHIRNGIKKAYTEVVNSANSVKSLKRVLDMQLKKLDAIRARHEAGNVSGTVLKQAQLDYEELEINYNCTLMDFNTKLMELEFLAGVGVN
jgi:outer membrane protein TolC